MDLKNSLILEPTKYLRNDPDIIFGKIKPRINADGLKEYPENYNPILEYWEQIQSNKIIVSKKVYQQYEEIVKWINNDGYKEWFYSSKRANHVIEFAENFCRHSKGKLAGQRVELELWEKAYIASVYGFIDIEGNRKHQRVILIVGKKNGKSLLASIMGLYGLIGDGEGGPEVYAVATKKDQSKIIWLESKRMVKKSPALRKRLKTLVSEISFELNDGVFKALASDSDSLDGLNIHVVLMDEWHQWKNGRALYDIMADGITAREQPLISMTSTAGTIREDIFDEIYEEAEIQFNNMKLGNEVDDRTLFFIYELDKKSEWRNANNWMKANPGLGTIKKLRALQDKSKRVANNLRLEKNFVCKEFNIRETSTETWLTFEELNNPATYDLSILKPRYGIGGSDLASTTDLTCGTVIFMVPNDSTIYVLQMYWLPEELLDQRVKEDKIPYDIWLEQGLLRTTPGNKVHYKYVTEWFQEVQNEYDIYIPWHGYDGWSAEYYVEEMRNYFGKDGMEPVIQGKKSLSGPMKSLGADLASKKINYNNNPILKWCLSNTSIDVDKNGNIQPVKTSNRRRRIDGTASLLDACVALERHYEDYINLI
ncbi:terminase large subunit [Clostridium sp. D2Q-11]|uniref:Terminase large subunit n=1 Tax=Anaeromonas frigoriresistens TaxID=2683708 RepID=A0A942Z8E7_9FIRM|nr:terminase TerL endonuclease subunit [Anaeromonas frigoriresistens]MBS4538208.1 terminase large subunit [Anaeromonas frigoriresistens]